MSENLRCCERAIFVNLGQEIQDGAGGVCRQWVFMQGTAIKINCANRFLSQGRTWVLLCKRIKTRSIKLRILISWHLLHCALLLFTALI